MPTTKKYINLVGFIAVGLFAIASEAANPPPNFELTIVESLPENINLDMKLSDIVKAKENSRLQVSKEKIYGVLLENLSPLLSDKTFTQDYNLMTLATAIPIQKIMDELVSEGAAFQQSNPADFLAVILPKAPVAYEEDSPFPYSAVYASNKAAVIDDAKLGFRPDLSYDDLINLRVLDAIQLAYKNTYIEHQSKGAFFVGALVHIHLAGPGSKIRLQVIGGIPTDQVMPFDQVEKEAHFTEVRSPKTPDFSISGQNLPGTVIELAYQNQQAVQLKLSFGSLGLINGKDWVLTDALPPFADIVLGTQSTGVTSLFKSYNVPNLFGEILQATGMEWGDKYLASNFKIQMNVHEVEMNIETLEITKMRVTAELAAKEVGFLTSLLAMPTLEQPTINQKFTDAGNESLKPYREKIQMLLSTDPLILLQDPQAQMEIFRALSSLLSSSGEGVL